MPSAGTTSLAGATLVLLVVGAGVGTQALDVTDRLEQALDRSVDGAMRDLAVRWIDVADAHGAQDNGTVERVRMLVRPSGVLGEVDTDEIVARSQPGQTLELAWGEALRDPDGSLANGTLNQGDLVEVRVNLSEPLEPRGERTVTLHTPEAAPATLEIASPDHYGEDRYVTLDVLVTR